MTDISTASAGVILRVKWRVSVRFAYLCFWFVLVPQTKHSIDWDSAEYITYCTNYKQRITLESWYTNLEEEPLNRSQQLPAPYKRLIHKQ